MKKIIVLAGGCFDLLHKGHLKFLEAAKKEGDFLIVALENDEKVKELKGTNRPVNSQNVRKENLLKTGLVNEVLVLRTLHTPKEYLQMVKKIKPDVIAITDNDPQKKNKQKHAKAVGAKLKVVIKRLPKFSTTEIINNFTLLRGVSTTKQSLRKLR